MRINIKNKKKSIKKEKKEKKSPVFICDFPSKKFITYTHIFF